MGTKVTNYKYIAEVNRFIVLDKYTKEGPAAENYQSEADLERELIEVWNCEAWTDHSKNKTD